MEPVGAAASLLTLLNAAGGTCKCLYTLILSIKDAPHDIRVQNEKLRRIHQTIVQLIHIQSKLPTEYQTGTPWHKWAAEFADEVSRVQARIERRMLPLESGGHTSKLLEGCRWLFFDRQLKKFFESLEHWNVVFSQAIAASTLTFFASFDQKLDRHSSELNALLRQLNVLDESPFKLLGGPQQAHSVPMIPATDNIVMNIYENSSTSSSEPRNPSLSLLSKAQNTRTLRRQATSVEFVATKAKHLAWYSTASSMVYVGPVVGRQTSPLGRDQLSILPNSIGLSVSFSLPFWDSRKLYLHIFGTMPNLPSSNLDIRFNLRTPRIFKVGSRSYYAAQRGDILCLKKGLQAKDISIADITPEGDTLLHIAARSSQISMIALLLDLGADPNATNDWGETPLHLAIAQAQDYDCAIRLLAAGADIFIQDMAGCTPLHTFYNPVIQQLLNSCCGEIDMFLEDNSGLTVMHYLCWTKCSSPAQLQIGSSKQRSTATPFSTQPDLNQPINVKDNLGRSILHLATERGNIEVMSYLLAHPQCSDLAQPDYCDRTLLFYAVQSRRVQAIDLVLQYVQDLDIKCKDDKGMTTMHVATTKRNLGAVKRLVELRGLEQLEIVCRDGKRALEIAEARVFSEIADYLRPLCSHRPLDAQEVSRQDEKQNFSESIRKLVILRITISNLCSIIILVFILVALLRIRKYG